MLLALAITLMVMDRRIEGFAKVRAFLSIPVAPLQYAVNWPIEFGGKLKVALSTQDTLVRENMQLKSEKLMLHAKLQRLLAVESENKYLKALMQSADRAKSKTLIADLLAVDAEPLVRQMVINKGTKNGVYLGQPVLDANGVVGQIVQTGPKISRVLLVTDPKSGVAVQDARNGFRAVAVGDSYSSNLRLMYVPKTADVRIGDIFMTSGLGDRYPEGYPVGRIVSVYKDPGRQFSTVYLAPSARLDTSRQVLLIWNQRHVG